MKTSKFTNRDPKCNPFNERAKQGFKYWNEKKKPIDCKLKNFFIK